MRTSMIRHRANTRFFIKYEDILDLCQGNQTQAALHRVLEAKLNVVVALLAERGETPTGERDECLWMTISLSEFVEWSLHDRDKSAYQRATEELIKDGFLDIRYVKANEDGSLKQHNGRFLTYATYFEARTDRLHDGPILKQYQYLYETVNTSLDASPSPTVPPPEGLPHHESDEEMHEKRVRGGNLRDSTTASPPSLPTIPQPVYSFEQAGTNGAVGGDEGLFVRIAPPVQTANTPSPFEQPPVVQTTSNKYYREESSTISQETTAPGGAVSPSENNEFDRETVERLAATILAPLPQNVKAAQFRENARRWQEAALAIASHPLFGLIGREAATDCLHQLMAYITDPASPSWWVREFPKKPRHVVRLWHLADNLQMIYLDMTRHPDWLASYSLSPAPAPAQEPQEACAGEVLPAAYEEPEEPFGMNIMVCNRLIEEIGCVLSRDYRVQRRRSAGGGFVADVYWSHYITTLYCPEGWAQLQAEMAGTAA